MGFGVEGQKSMDTIREQGKDIRELPSNKVRSLERKTVLLHQIGQRGDGIYRKRTHGFS